ncbi:MAG: hypothetical protein LBK61_10890 [Spirochaetaceae bacterium]|jgi:hypothetical protein|nr:hypothetical protein [Spirochaetaceae bacterium]
MKKIVLAMLVVLAAAGIVSAQSLPWGGAQPQSVQGTLGLQNGAIVLFPSANTAGGNTVCYVPHLSRYAGFIDGLKEGAQVRLDGCSMGNGFFVPSKITVGGKDYDISEVFAGHGGCGPDRGHRGGHGYGRGCR